MLFHEMLSLASQKKNELNVTVYTIAVTVGKSIDRTTITAV